MKMLSFLLFVAISQLSARTFAQSFTLSVKDQPLETVFTKIQQQSQYRFIYTRKAISTAKKVTLNVRDASLQTLLSSLFEDQPLNYSVEDNFIIISQKDSLAIAVEATRNPVQITGRIINHREEPVPLATISIKGTSTVTTTNEAGLFVLHEVDTPATILISSVGYRSRELPLNSRTNFLIRLSPFVNNLEETVVVAYGSTTRKLNTGSVSKISGETISSQPVNTTLPALQGRVPGLMITQSNGLPGSSFTVKLRGQNSIQQGNDPLYIVDGVPFITSALTQFNGIGTNNPFNTLNPLDIESIEVLKDADATAIYGSRGANGVILITTKKARQNQTTVTVQFYQGWGKVTRTLDYLNTQQYVEMRKEAFANDNRTPTSSSAFDLLLWDTTRYINWKKQLIGGTAHSTNANVRVSGGTNQTKFSLSSNYSRETTVYPTKKGTQRVTLFSNASHRSLNNKFSIQFSAGYGFDKSELLPEDLTNSITLSPNSPKPFDSTGALNWAEGGFPYANPYGIMKREYNVNTERFTSSLILSYQFLSSLKAQVNFGYNSISSKEESLTPIASQNPADNPTATALFANNDVKSWIAEPQLDFDKAIGTKSKILIQAGGSFLENKRTSFSVNAFGISNDAQIKLVSAATSSTYKNSETVYRYAGVFARFNYNWDNRYIINLTGRRDGSSRFGPAKRFANFGAAGLAWLFSNETFAKNWKWLSFGKIRTSYGITGNDQIGDYKYFDLLSNTQYPYNGQPGLRPVQLFNDQFNWEQIKKIELGIELSFFKSRLNFTTNFYRNRSDNQYVSTTLPSQTGFTDITQSIPGVVENKGIEFDIQSVNIDNKKFQWSSKFNLTIERNKLVQFPGLSTSVYASNYMIGKPLSNVIGYRFLGVDPQTGVYSFDDIDKNGTIDNGDRIYGGTFVPTFYGGLENNFQLGNWQLDIFLQFIKQDGRQPVYNNILRPGVNSNQPIAVLDRWKVAGDNKPYQKYNRTGALPAGIAGGMIVQSSAVLTDASFLRVKSVSLSYKINPDKAHSLLRLAEIFARAQNLFTITNYTGPDPESQSINSLPPIRMIVFGFNANF